MEDISKKATDLLITLKRIKKTKSRGGDFIDKRRVLVEYGFDQNSKQLDELFSELENNGYIIYQRGAYRLLAKALNKTYASRGSRNVTIYSDVNNSNIAHMSSNLVQKLQINNLDEETKLQLELLIEAVKKKDKSRIQSIFDGLVVSSPALVLQILQIGLGIK